MLSDFLSLLGACFKAVGVFVVFYFYFIFLFCIFTRHFILFRRFIMRRHGMSRGRSKRSFVSGYNRVHPKNSMNGVVMRGGIRL